MKTHKVSSYIKNPSHPISVHVVGAGGTGSQVLSSLARINTSLIELGNPGLHVTVYDPDEVSEANIGRQLFCYSDIGANKAEVLTTRLNRFFGSGWTSVPSQYILQKGKGRPNLLITCVDTAKARIEIGKIIHEEPDGSDTCKKGLYWLDFGNTQNTGQVVLGTISKLDSDPLKTILGLFDLTQVVEEDQGPSCSLAEALSRQDLFINSTLANLGCNLLWKLLTQKEIDHHGLYLNLQTMAVKGIPVS